MPGSRHRQPKPPADVSFQEPVAAGGILQHAGRAQRLALDQVVAAAPAASAEIIGGKHSLRIGFVAHGDGEIVQLFVVQRRARLLQDRHGRRLGVLDAAIAPPGIQKRRGKRIADQPPHGAAGEVAVLASDRAASDPTLQANQSLVFDAASKSISLQTVDPAKSLAWRGGKIAFERTYFAEAIAELDRYFPGRILTFANAARMSPVTGIVNTRDLVAGIRAIAAVEELEVTEVPGGLLLLLP